MYSVRFIDSLEKVEPAQWNRLAGGGQPFLRHEFLAALERSGSVGGGSGWEPQHALVERDGKLVALLPLYRKAHSWGEYVFDWSWAEAYQRHHLPYYPKLVAAIPFTPSTGPRLCIAAGEAPAAVTTALIDALRQRLHSEQLSSLHILFPEAEEAQALVAAGMSHRLGLQYQWFNRGYGDFEDFLAACTARKRKSLRRERDRVRQQGVTFRWVAGGEASAEEWQLFEYCYELTYAKRSGHSGYLNGDFFRQLGAALPEQVLLLVAEQHGKVIASALYLRDETTLYGRYWGCLRELDALHFETCYYQGIDYCIREGLNRFDAGAQGEHKLLRGFEPVLTHSCHWIVEPRFRAAIDHFLAQEQRQIQHHLESARSVLPYREGAG
jgi:predicted N-acyltransferase